MKKQILLSLLLVCGLAHAEPTTDKPASEQLLDAIQYEQTTIDAAMAGFDGFIGQMKQNGVSDAAIAEIRKEAGKIYAKIFSAPEMRKKTAELYEKHFTEDELLQLVEFYRSPLGRKTLAGMPSVMKDAVTMAMPAIQKEMPAFQQKIQEIVEKHQAKPTPDDEEGAEKPESEKK